MKPCVLVIRYAALGDIAIALPVVYGFALANPEREVLFLTESKFVDLAVQRPDNLRVLGFEHKKQGSLRGLWHVWREIHRQYRVEAVADLQSVLRSWWLCLLFRLSGATIAGRKKDYAERKPLLRLQHKQLLRLRDYHQRFSEVIARLGYTVSEQVSPFRYEAPFSKPANQRWVGIAYSAAAPTKIYPTEQMEEVIRCLSEQAEVRMFLFGGGAEDARQTQRWEAKYPAACSVVGRYPLAQEMGLIQQMDVMLTMDSGNMHLAALAGTPVLAIWGSTHPYVGFRPWKQEEAPCLQVDLPCRPCSEWGSQHCPLGHFQCMRSISPQQVVQTLQSYLDHAGC